MAVGLYVFPIDRDGVPCPMGIEARRHKFKEAREEKQGEPMTYYCQICLIRVTRTGFIIEDPPFDFAKAHGQIYETG